MDGSVARHGGAVMCPAEDSVRWRCWSGGWLLGPLTVLWLAFGAAVAHKGGTTGYATVSIAGQTVRYAITLPAEGVLPNDVTAQDLRDFAAALARHLLVSADNAACAGVPAEVRSSSPERASIEIVLLYACSAP